MGNLWIYGREGASLALLGPSVVIVIGGLSRNTVSENASIRLTFSTILVRHVDMSYMPIETFIPRQYTTKLLRSPRQYILYNPEKPEEPNPEQTASLLSFTLYNFTDPNVFKAWKASKVRLEREDLPPLQDYDQSYNLRAWMFSNLDPTKPLFLVEELTIGFSSVRPWSERCTDGFKVPVVVKGLSNYTNQTLGVDIIVTSRSNNITQDRDTYTAESASQTDSDSSNGSHGRNVSENATKLLRKAGAREYLATDPLDGSTSTVPTTPSSSSLSPSAGGILLFDVNQLSAAKVSLDHIADFLYDTELLDTFKQKDDGTIEEVFTSIISSESSQDIAFRNAAFIRSYDSNNGTFTPSHRRFRSTGCGKTDKGIAYAAQESGVRDAIIKNGIVFRSEFSRDIRRCFTNVRRNETHRGWREGTDIERGSSLLRALTSPIRLGRQLPVLERGPSFSVFNSQPSSSSITTGTNSSFRPG
ncbi:hypothetical protein K435DRAFT_856219 [Dendrothele bispora CBS 962.96]|uniref:Uncharacterized protein n=1 Tax=Dendrothele bispora (strain CBS 962.96) TaxID=1314807 RepID=A0A4S8M915_DENBC|nr:hypothetical protein K435DRAFT_856219 [Dendrothele bispora CBS 962.96]